MKRLTVILFVLSTLFLWSDKRVFAAAFTWKSGAGSDWSEPSNWQEGSVPSGGAGVIIPELNLEVGVEYPVIDEDLSANVPGYLLISKNASVGIISGGKLAVYELISESGAILEMSGTSFLYISGPVTWDADATADLKLGTVEFNGGSDDQFIPAFSFFNLNINKGSKTAYLTDHLETDNLIAGTFTCTLGAFNTNDFNMEIAKDFSVLANGDCYLGGSTITVSRSWSNLGNVDAASSTVYFTGGTGIQNSSITGNATVFNEVVILKSLQSDILEWDCAASVSGTLQLLSGTLDVYIADLTAGAYDFDQSGTTVRYTFGYNDLIEEELDIIEPTVELAAAGTIQYVQSATYYNLTVLQGAILGLSCRLEGAVNVLNDFYLTSSPSGFLTNNNTLNIDRDLYIGGSTFNAGSSTINVGRNFLKPLGTFTAGTSNILLDGSSSGEIRCNHSLYQLNITKSATAEVFASAAVTVTNRLAINNSSTTFYLSGQTLTATGATFVNNGIFKLKGTETITNLTQDVDSGTWTYVGDNTAGTLTAKEFGATDYFNLTINDANANERTFELGAACSVAGALTITDGKFSTAATNQTLTVTGNVTIAAAGTLLGNASTINAYGNWQNDGTFTYGTSTVVLLGGGDTTVDGGAFYSLTISKTLPGKSVSMTESGTTCHGTLNVDTGIFSTTSSNYTLTLNGDLTIGLNGTFSMNKSLVYLGKAFSNLGVFDYDPLGIVHLISANAQSLPKSSWPNLYITKDALANTVTLTSKISVDGNFTIYVGTFSTGVVNAQVTIEGNFTLFNFATSCAANFNASSVSCGGTFDANFNQLTAGTSTVTMTGATTPAKIYIGTSAPFYNLTINKTNTSDTVHAETTLTVSNNLTITKGTLSARNQANTITSALNVDGDFSMVAGGTFLGTSGTHTMGKSWTNTGTFTPGTCTISFDANTSANIGASTFYALALNKGLATNVMTMTGNVSCTNNLTINQGKLNTGANYSLGVTGTLTIGAGDELVANNSAISVGANFTRSGTFTPGASTVTFNTAANSTVTGTTFYNIIVNKSLATASVFQLGAMITTVDLQVTMGIWDTNSTFSFALTVGNDLIIETDGEVKANASSVGITGDFINNSGTLTAGTSTFTMSGNTDTTLTVSPFRNLVINKSNAVNKVTLTLYETDGGIEIFDPFEDNIELAAAGGVFSGSMIMTGYLTVTQGELVTGNTLFGITVPGNLTISANGTITSSGSSFTVSGNWVRSGTFTAGTGTVNFQGTGDNTVDATTFYRIGLNKTSTKKISQNGAVVANNTTVITSGIWDTTASNHSFQSVGNLTILASGTFLANDSSVTLGGNISNSGTFTAGTSDITMNGASKFISTDLTVYDIIIDGSVTASGNLVVNNDLTVNSAKTLNGAAGKSFDISGDFELEGTYGTVLNHTVIFSGANPAELKGATSKDRDLYTCIINKPGTTWTYTAGFDADSETNNLSIANFFVLLDGTIDFGFKHGVTFDRSARFFGGIMTPNDNYAYLGSGNGNGSWKVDIDIPFTEMNKQGTGMITLQSNSTVEPDVEGLVVSDGTFRMSKTMTCNPAIYSAGTLEIDSGAALNFDGALEIWGTLVANGKADERATLTGTGGNQIIDVKSSASFKLEYADISNLSEGMNLSAITTGTIHSFHDVFFDYADQDGAVDYCFNLSGLALNRFGTLMRQNNLVFFDNIGFGKNGTANFNVESTELTTVRCHFRNSYGSLGGEGYENDPYNRLTWISGLVKNTNTLETFNSLQEAIDAASNGDTIAGQDSNVFSGYFKTKTGVTLRDLYLEPARGGVSKNALTGVMDNDWAVNVVVRGGNISNVAYCVNCTVDGNIYGGDVLANNILVGKRHAISDQDPSIILAYHMEGNADDSGPVGLNGSTSGAIYEAYNWGSACSFDGTNDNIQATLPGLPMQFTATCWFEPGAMASRARIFGKGSAFYVEYDPNIGTTFYGQTTSDSAVEGSTINYNFGTMQHVALTYDGATLKFYMNGSLVGAGLAQTGQPSDSGSFRIGETDTGTKDFGGYIDDMVIYSRTLSAEEIAHQALCSVSTLGIYNKASFNTASFVGYPIGDFHLKAGAFGIDAGDATLWDDFIDPDTDFDGRNRYVNGGSSLNLDFGAFEFDPNAIPNFTGNQIFGGVNDLALNIVNNVIYIGTDSSGPDSVKNRVIALGTNSQGGGAGTPVYDSPNLGGSVINIFFTRVNNKTVIIPTVDTDDDGKSDALVPLEDTGADIIYSSDLNPGGDTLFPADTGLETSRPGGSYAGPLSKAILIAEGNGDIHLYVVNSDNGVNQRALCKYDVSDRSILWSNTGSGGDGHDYRGVPAFVSAAYYGGATGGTADIIRVTSTNSETTVRALGSSTGIASPMFWKTVSGTQWLFAAPIDNFIYKLDSSNLNIAWTSANLGGTTQGGIISPTTAVGSDCVYISANNKTHRVKIADGASETLQGWNGGVSIMGNISSNIVARDGYLYFGTDLGWCYCLNIGDATASVPGYPYRLNGGGAVKVVGVNAADGEAYFVSQWGFFIALQLAQ